MKTLRERAEEIVDDQIANGETPIEERATAIESVIRWLETAREAIHH